MTGKKVRRNCILKVVQVAPPIRGSFTKTVQQAVETLSKASDRRLELEKDSGRYRVLNDFFEPLGKGRAASGSVFAFTMNANMNGVVLDPEAKSYPMKVLSPQRDTSVSTEFVEGLTWFAAKDNYLAILSSKAVSLDVLEEYFSWLLGAAQAKQRSRTDSIEYAVHFADPPKPELRSYNMANLKSIVFKGGVQSAATTTEVRENESGSEPSFSIFHPVGTAYSALKGLVEACGASLPNFEGADTPETFSNLNIELRVSVAKGKNSGAALSFLRRTAENIRDADDETMEYRFSDGRTLKPSQLIVSSELLLDVKEGLPDSVQARHKLESWLLEQVSLIENPPIGVGGTIA